MYIYLFIFAQRRDSGFRECNYSQCKQVFQLPRVELSLNTRPSEGQVRGWGYWRCGLRRSPSPSASVLTQPAYESLSHQSHVPQVPDIRVQVIEHSPVGPTHHTTVELCYFFTQRQEPGSPITPLINLRHLWKNTAVKFKARTFFFFENWKGKV